MLVIARKGAEDQVLKTFEKWGLHAAEIGQVTSTKRMIVKEKGQVVADVPPKALTDQAPTYQREAKKPSYIEQINRLPDLGKDVEEYNDDFLKLISEPTIASKEWIFQQYDHMVMVNTVVLPGSDAAVLRLKESGKLIAMTTDCNGRYCYLNPYQGAIMAVSEASRNLVVSGARPIGLTDCLNFGNPTKPEVFWQFQKSIEGIRDACLKFGIPVTGGNVSFYNESPQGAVYPTPAIGMVGVIDSEKDITTVSFKESDDLVFLVGGFGSGLGGSEYLWRIRCLQNGPLPEFSFEKELKVQDFISQSIKEGWLQSAHDLSEGGLAVALAECAIQGKLGVECHLPEGKLRRDEMLFGESPSRALISLKSEFKNAFIEFSQSAQVEVVMIGQVGGNRLRILQATKSVIDCQLEEVGKIWRVSIESWMKKI